MFLFNTTLNINYLMLNIKYVISLYSENFIQLSLNKFDNTHITNYFLMIKHYSYCYKHCSFTL